MNTKVELLEMQLQVDELGQQMTQWRQHLAWQEEIAFFAARTEELARRLNALEKRIAHEHHGEAVEIRFCPPPFSGGIS